MYRELLKREIERVQMGLDPKGTIRDPDHAIIDTHLMESIAEVRIGLGRMGPETAVPA
jgi:hypothetical protein